MSDSVPAGRPMIASGSWASALETHPRLLGPRDFVRGLAASKHEFYEEMKTLNAKQWRERIGHGHVGTNDLLSAAVIHAVDGLPREALQPYLDMAMTIVAAGAVDQHQQSWVNMEQVVLVYDLFHEFLTPEQRRQTIEYLNAQFYIFTDDECSFHNSTPSKMHCYLRVAYGTWGDNPLAPVFRDYAIKRLYEHLLVPVFREFGAGGGWTECGWYCRHSLWHLVQGLELARRFGGYDGYQQVPSFFYNRLAFELHQPYPGLWQHGAERYSCEGDGQSIYSEFNEFPRLMRTVIAQYFRGSELARLTAARKRPGTSLHVRLFDFLYEEPADAPLALDTAPLSHLASGAGKLYARGDWSDDATWLRFECGPWWNQHQHFEAGNFEIFRREPLATESGEYADWAGPHAINWLVRSIAHNCILIHDPSERWHYCRNREHRPMANDGGQGNVTLVTFAIDGWKAFANELQRGHIAAYRTEPAFTYVAGDATKAYSDAKAKLVLRQIVFIRPHTFVILDTVVSTRPEFAKTWVMHCQDEPAIDGCRATITNGKGELHVQTLLPAQPKIAKIHGYTYGGQTFDEPRSYQPADLLPKWRIEVQPSEPREEDLFLHVLSTDGPVAAALVRQDDLVGVQAAGWKVLLNPQGGGSITVAGATCEVEEKIVAGPYEA